MILSIPTTFVLFCTEPQIINADLGFQHFKLIIKIYKQDWISIKFSIQHADHTFCTLHISCQLTLSEVKSTQILLIFESMQHCRNEQKQEKLLTHFCWWWWWCFHASIFLALMLAPQGCLMLCSPSRWPYKIHCCNYCIFWSLLHV